MYWICIAILKILLTLIIFSNICSRCILKYSIFSETEGKMIYSEKIERNELLNRQMSYFLECIKKNQNTMNPISEAYEVLKICLNEESK